MTSSRPTMVLQSRNDVRFRNYQKFGAELKVVDEVGEDDDADTRPTSVTPPQTNQPTTPAATPPPVPEPSPTPEKPAADGAPPIPKLKKKP